MAKVIDDSNFSEILAGGQPLMVDFWAPWCTPCKLMSPVVEELAEEYEGKVIIAKCNVDDASESATQLHIRSIPTLVLFKNGELVERFVGLVAKQDVKEALDAMLLLDI